MTDDEVREIINKALEPDKVPAPYQRNVIKFQKYMELLDTCHRLQEKGIISQYDADNPFEPYEMHCVSVWWTNDDITDSIDIDVKVLTSMLERSEGLVISTQKKNDFWQFSTEMYRKSE